MTLDPKYHYLEENGVLPKLLTAGLPYLGTKEVPGKGSNSVIINMAKELGIQDIYTDDDTSWCALFINFLIKKTGKPMLEVNKDPYNYLRAKYMLNWGDSVKHGEEQLGDILIFDREGGGHVGIYAGETGTTYIVFGGNQSNQVGFTEILKSRLLGARRFYATHAPASAKKYIVDSSGKISSNEA